MNKRHEFIKDNYSKMTNAEIAEKLGMTADSVTTIACKLGVKKYYTVEDLDGEEWRTHPDYPNYLVSNKGRIKSKVRNRLISTRVHEGYYDCRINNKDGKKKSPRIHRLVAEVFVDAVEGKPIVNHIDGNKLNNNADNLEWSTHSENIDHAITNGLAKFRTDTLKEHEVHAICKLLSDGKSYSYITGQNPRYTRGRVEKIRQRARWTEISQEYNW